MIPRFIVATTCPQNSKNIFDLETGHIYSEKTWNMRFATKLDELEKGKFVFCIATNGQTQQIKLEIRGPI